MKGTMTERSSQEHILISLTASWGAEEAIETGAVLAAILGFGVTGHFKHQEINLGLGEFPFAMALLPGGLPAERITRSSMERAIQRQSAHCRKLLHDRANRFSLTWSYHDTEPVEQVDEVENIGMQVLPRNQMFPDVGELLSNVRNVTMRGGTAVVSASRQTGSGTDTIVAIIDPSRDYLTILQQAARLVSAGNRSLVVLMVSDREEPTENFEEEISSFIDPAAKLSFARPAHDSVNDIVVAITQMAPTFVVATLEDGLFADEANASSLLRSVNSAIILVAPDKEIS